MNWPYCYVKLAQLMEMTLAMREHKRQKCALFFSWLISFCFYIISLIVHINYLVNEYFMLDVQKNDMKYRDKATVAYSNVLCCEETTRLQEIHSLETKLQFG